jgi:hypothetical protein
MGLLEHFDNKAIVKSKGPDVNEENAAMSEGMETAEHSE